MYRIVCKNCFQFPKKIAVIDEILKYRGMKIGLQNAVCAVHVTIGSDMQNLITATDIGSGARASLDESASVVGKI
jgi:hypothetical protein